MSDLFTPFSNFMQTQLDASRRISEALFSVTGKLDHAMLDVTHQAVDEQLRFAQAASNTRDPQAYSNLQSTYWASKLDEAQLFQERMMQIIAVMQDEFARAAQSCVEQMNVQRMQGSASNPFGTSGYRGPSATNPFGGVMSTWQTAMRGMSSIGDQAITTAHTGVALADTTAAQAGTYAMAEAAVAAVASAQQPPSESDTLDEAEAESGSSHSRPHGGARHRNGVESRAEQRRAGPTRRK